MHEIKSNVQESITFTTPVLHQVQPESRNVSVRRRMPPPCVLSKMVSFRPNPIPSVKFQLNIGDCIVILSYAQPNIDHDFSPPFCVYPSRFSGLTTPYKGGPYDKASVFHSFIYITRIYFLLSSVSRIFINKLSNMFPLPD